MQLGQLSRHGRLARAQALRHVGERLGQPLRGFEKTSVAGMALSSASAVRRSPGFAGRNPANRNRSVGRPETVSAASAADGAGHGIDRNPLGDARL